MRILHVVTAFPRAPDDVIVPWLVELLKRLQAARCGWAARRARPARLVTTFYGVELRWVKCALPFLKGFLAWAARRSDRVSAISNYTAGELRELADLPIEVIPYTTSLPDVTPAPAPALPPAPTPASAALDGTGPVLFVGRLVERKGVAHLIEAMARLGRGDEGPRLEIVGDGPERPRLEALVRRLGVENRVAFRGKIASDELQASYARAAVCVLPSVLDARGDTEGLGVVLLEAMNHATPVIASRVGGIPDIVEDGVSGLLVPPGDADALAAAVRRLRDDPDLARRLGEGGRRRPREQCNWTAIVRRWLDLYAGLVTRPRA